MRDDSMHAVRATATRYPGLDEPVFPQEHAEAVAAAEAVVRWAEEQL